MNKKLAFACATSLLLVGSAQGQGQPDARSVLQAASAAMGANNMTSFQVSGTGYVGAVGQNFAPDRDWPHFDMKSYTRTVDLNTGSSREEMVVVQGNNVPQGGGGTPIVGEQTRIQLVSGSVAWNMNGTNVVPQPALAEQRQLEVMLSPYGFLKYAMANNPTAVTRNEYDQRVTVVSFVALGKYRVNGTINAQNQVQRVQTWIANPVVGDLYYENVYTLYRTINGVQVPGRWHQHQDFDDGGTPNPSGGDHAFSLDVVTDFKVNVPNAGLTVPDAARNATVPAVTVTSTRLGDGLWLIGGGTHNSVAIEFRDHVAVIEGPLNEARSLAVIGEVTRLIPNKPVRFVINTHHHWDHLGGLRTFVHEGATIVTHDNNKAYYQEVLRPRPWVLQPDRYSLFPPEEWSEGYVFETVREKYVLADDTRTVELYSVQGLQHAAGMLIAYFPKEKIVVNADLYTPPAAGAPMPTPNLSARIFYNNLQRLKLDVAQHVPIHGNPGPAAQFTQIIAAAAAR